MSTIVPVPSLTDFNFLRETRHGDKLNSDDFIKQKAGDLEFMGRLESLLNRIEDLSDKSFDRAVKTGQTADLFAAQRALDIKVGTHEWFLTYVSVLQKSMDRLTQMNQ